MSLSFPRILVIASLFVSCTKTKIGTYILVIDGTRQEVQRDVSGPSADTTGTYKNTNYHLEKEVKVNYVGNSTIEIDGAIWQKDGIKVNGTTYSDSRQFSLALGGYSIETEVYNGEIISRNLIEGDYNYNDYGVSAGHYHSTTIKAKFILRRR